jgi:hypothetical protein
MGDRNRPLGSVQTGHALASDNSSRCPHQVAASQEQLTACSVADPLSIGLAAVQGARKACILVERLQTGYAT